MKDKLIESNSKEALQQNIQTEIKSGKDPKQAAAIAYSVQRANDTDTAELLYCVIEFTESDYYGLTSRVGKQITIDAADTLIRNADMAHTAKNKSGYDKTYLDLYAKYNGHKYRIHLLRFDIGDGPQHMNVKEKANNVLKRIPELIENTLYRNHVKQLDATNCDIKPGMYKHKNGQVYKSNEVKAQYELEKPNTDLQSWVTANYTRVQDAGVSTEKMAQAEYNNLKAELKELQKQYDDAENNASKQNYIQQKISAAYDKLNKFKTEWEYCLHDGYTGEIRNISGKLFKGSDGKIYQMPNYTYAMYSPEHNAYYGFKNQNNMPYTPVGGKSALQQVLGSGGFLNLEGMILVKPIRDANNVLREYSKFENSKLYTGQVVKHNNGYTFVASDPKEDKDSNSLQQLEQYITGKGYKPVY